MAVHLFFQGHCGCHETSPPAVVWAKRAGEERAFEPTMGRHRRADHAQYRHRAARQPEEGCIPGARKAALLFRKRFSANADTGSSSQRAGPERAQERSDEHARRPRWGRSRSAAEAEGASRPPLPGTRRAPIGPLGKGTQRPGTPPSERGGRRAGRYHCRLRVAAPGARFARSLRCLLSFGIGLGLTTLSL